MYENETRELIRQRLLERLPEYLDNREGSIAWDVLSPISIEFELLYQIADNMLNMMFADTSSDFFLDLRCAEMGIYRKPAVISSGTVRLSGSPGMLIPKGTKVSTGGDLPIYFVSTRDVVIPEYPSPNQIDVTFNSEYGGAYNNIKSGELSFVTGDMSEVLFIVSNTDFTGGIDLETDAALLDRYFDRVLNPATSGNKNQYVQWVKSVTNVSDCLVQPLYYGNGTVRILVLDAEKSPASPELITQVKNYLETVRPIGADVRVEPAGNIAVDVSANLTLSDGYELDEIKSQFSDLLNSYLDSLAFSDPVIRYTRISNLLLSIPGVLDYDSLTINGSSANLTVTEGVVGIVGVITFE